MGRTEQAPTALAARVRLTSGQLLVACANGDLDYAHALLADLSASGYLLRRSVEEGLAFRALLTHLAAL